MDNDDGEVAVETTNYTATLNGHRMHSAGGLGQKLNNITPLM